MRKINLRLTQGNSLWSQMEQIYFITEFKNPNKTDLQVCTWQFLYTQCALHSA